jgi:hypothetical protein
MTRTTALQQFEAALTPDERRLVRGLSSPAKIQDWLDGIRYSADDFYRCPLRVVRDRVGHCYDGGIFAAAMLRRLGYPPRVVDLLPNGRDDDHLLAIYRLDGRWGAVAKSNFSGLRYREPVYGTLRELVLSYFEQYYNVAREKTLRGYTAPLSLARYDRLGWMVRDEPLDQIADDLDKVRKTQLLTPRLAARLAPVDERSYQAGLMGSLADGLFKLPAAAEARTKGTSER